jgi:tetratricopeptide (TPR) repeat protein
MFSRYSPCSKAIALAILACAQLVLGSAYACPCAFDPSGPYTAAANAAMASKDYAGALSYMAQALKYDKDNPNIIYNMALMYLATGNYQDAEANMIKSIDILSNNYGKAHRQVAQGYIDLGALYENQATDFNKPELKQKTEDCYMKSIALCEEIYSDVSGKPPAQSKQALQTNSKESNSKHKSKKICDIDLKQAQIDLSGVMRHLADFYNTDDNYKQAEPLYSRALELEQKAYGPDNKEVCKHKADLAKFYCEASKPQLAEPLFKEVLASLEKNNELDSRAGVQVLYEYGNLYRDQDKYNDAEIMLKRSVDVLSKLTPDEMDFAEKTSALADVLDKQGKKAEAEKLCENLVASLEKGGNKEALMVALKQYHKHFLVLHNKIEAEKIAGKIKILASQVSKDDR